MMSTDTDVEDSNATIQCADAEEHPSDAQPGTSDDRPQRQRFRKLTLPAQEEYNARVNKYNHDLSIVTGEIDAAISHIDNFQHDKSSLGSLQKLILSCQESYDDLSEKFIDYLKSMRTVESSDEEGRHSRIRYRYGLKLDLAYSRIKMLLKPAPVVHALGDTQFSNAREPLEKTFPSDNRSVHSASSASSSKSSIMGRKLAKLEAAIVRKQYLEKEIELIRKKAELEAQMKLLDVERNIETRRTELEAMNRQGSLKPPSEITDSHSRTQEYVNALPLSSLNGDGVQQHGGELQLDPNAPVFQPQQPCVPLTNQLNDMTKFLLKKDMILARITAYDDNPSSYLTWKQTFKSLMRELSATPAEELDLLIRWLGTESKQQAATIRRCNADDPVKAVKLIWERMEERFGAPELIESFLKRQIASFPKIGYRDYKKLYGLADLAAEIASVKKQPQYSTLFGYFDSPTGINLLVAKLPNNLQDKWTTEASKYKNREHVVFPPFSFFLAFIKNMAKMKNDPSFNFEPDKERPLTAPRTRNQGVVQVRKTETTDSDKVKPFLSNDGSKSETTGENDKSPRCPVHHTRHLLNDCKGFRAKTLAERKTFIFSNGICIKCCGPKKHRAKNCTTSVECGICKRTSHPTALHVEESKPEGEIVQSSCTQVCGTQYGASKSCAKIIPVRIYPDGLKQQSRIIYAMIDDQSNHCLASTSFFDAFNITGPEYEYTLISCSGTVTTSGRKAIGFVVESLAGDRCLNLPTLIECELPNNRDEIPSPRVATAYPHLKDIKDSIPAIINDAEIEILIGRDLISAHFVLDQRRGTGNAPYAQRLPLGWVVIGSVCLDTVHIPETVTACKTFVLGNGRTSHFEPCDKRLTVKENIFLKTDNDEKIAPSIEDNIFLEIMDRNLRKDDDGHWVAPLPFHPSRPPLPNNRSQALNRALSLDRSLHRSSTKKEHVSEFMNRIFEKGHAEKAPDIPDTKERWYLPMFGVYHPKKPEAIRMVFDSSARFNGIALNEVLLKGPDISNDLRGILLRFRRERIAMTADVEQMFHNFRVREDHRDYLRFLWHPMNDLNLPLEEFRMTVHVFGNRPSPAIATYGLRRSVDDADDDVKDFVNNDFYVDDALRSCPDVETAVDLMRRTQTALQDGVSLRLHKIASNSKSVLLQFPKEDLSKDLKDIDIGEDDLPMQRSLGLSWDINADVFTFKTSLELKPFTRRGILSTINSLYDPLGFTSPVTLQGKLLLRQMMSNSQNTGWDDPLDESFVHKWAAWVDSLRFLGTLRFPRMYSNMSVEKATRTEVHIFSDASKDAIAAVAFLKTWNETNCETSFLMGKAKVAPTHGHTIPRLELCSAVLGVEIGEIIREQMRLPSECFWFYTDSQVALGYIANEARRFYVYVANRVSRIRSFCGPEHWQHVPTDQNPADLATRNFEAKDLAESIWITGPSFLKRNDLRRDA
ncbi:hypothetical protein FSP39_021780 [Pinctada imbricata]|uniref:Peptidase aspartic putative domain-containing protein n=1 Tax=Pinctada imbricata TaxID=66713 RepID=A0AA88XWR6_PINIB|nr:hypothetical protein FSP39_021780 [Pinctada imbricata]